jgi:hypothetical protein
MHPGAIEVQAQFIARYYTTQSYIALSKERFALALTSPEAGLLMLLAAPQSSPHATSRSL